MNILEFLRNHMYEWFNMPEVNIKCNTLTHCILNGLSHTIYWKSPISILGTSGYEIYIFLEKNG